MTGYKKTLTTAQILDLATFVYKSAHADRRTATFRSERNTQPCGKVRAAMCRVIRPAA